MFAPHYKLDNLTAFIDFNGLQIDGDITKVMNPCPIDEKFIDNLEQNSTLYVYEDVIYNGSLASNLLSYVNKNKLNIKIVSISLKNTYVHEGKVDELKKRHLISLDDLMTIVKEGITKC